MKWSWRLGSFHGIEIKVHVTFLLALLWGAAVFGGGSQSWLWGVTLTVALFGLVLLHELGHALAARRYGIAVQDIVLLPIGGLARLSRMPEKPGQELVVALAGPAVNLALFALLAPAVVFGVAQQGTAGAMFALREASGPSWLGFALFLWQANLTLLLFNLLPAFPMDGGRVLRALLALRLPYVRATTIAAMVGQAFALFFGAAAFLTGNPGLALIAVFVFFGAGSEGQQASYRERLRRITVTEALDNDVPVLPADLPAHVAFQRIERSQYPAMAAVDAAGRFVGLVSRDGMARQWAAGARGPVAAFAEQPVLALECDTSLEHAVQRMAEADARVAAVYCGNVFAGLLDFKAVAQAIAAQGRTSRLAPDPI